MYPGYGRANPGPSNPVLLPDSRIPKLRQGSPIMMVPYGYNPAATNAPVPAVRTTQQRYYDANPAQAAQVQNPYTGQVSGYPRPSSPVPASFNQVYYQPAIQNKQAWPVKAAPNHNYIQAEGVINNTDGDNNYYDDDDDDDDDDDGTEFRAVGFQDSLTQYPFYERGAYAMFYSREQCIAECHQQPVNILMVLGRGGELGFPGGHIEHTDQSVIDGLNRELREEINIKRRHQLNQGDHVLTLVRHQPPFVEHFYIHEILPSEFVEIEKKVPGGHRWGIEIFGVIRVPLSVDEDGIKGFPSFLSNRFMHNARSLLIEGIQLRQLMHRKQLKELVRVSDRYLQKTSKTPQ